MSDPEVTTGADHGASSGPPASAGGADPSAPAPTSDRAIRPTAPDGTPDRPPAGGSSANRRRRGSRGGSGARPTDDGGNPDGDVGRQAADPENATTQGRSGGPRAKRAPAAADADADGTVSARGGGSRSRKPRPARGGEAATDGADGAPLSDVASGAKGARGRADRNPELPDRHIEGRPKSTEAAEQSLVRRKPQIGDTMPAAPLPAPTAAPTPRSGKGGGRNESGQGDGGAGGAGGGGQRKRRRRGGRGAGAGGGSTKQVRPVQASLGIDDPFELDEEALRQRGGRSRKGKAVGRYQMNVHVTPEATQIAVLEGRALLEHYVSRPADDVFQIHGNIYVGRVQNVLPGMEAAFVDIATPKNAVLYRGDVHFDAEDLERGGQPRIEEVLKARQLILTQVTKNPIAHKGARLTQEVSLPGRFAVLVPNSSTYGISKRLPDDERKRLRQILDRVKPPQHGIIVRTAAENVTSEEIERDVGRLVSQWEQIEALASQLKRPGLVYREPEAAVRIIREEFNADYRAVVIDDRTLYEEIRDYVHAISPALADRVQLYDVEAEPLPLFERFHVHQQLEKALDRKVWLPSGGSLIVEHTEALTVIDVNTGKNVGSSSLEETVFRNNLEAAVEIARQLRLRDIGGIIVIDFVDMEIKDNREQVVRVFRDALSMDKTRTQVFSISELGLVEMTRKRIGEGLLESFSHRCEQCDGRGLSIDDALMGQV